MAYKICVCNEASKEDCALCDKFHIFKPNRIFNHPSWKRNVDDVLEIKEEMKRRGYEKR